MSKAKVFVSLPIADKPHAEFDATFENARRSSRNATFLPYHEIGCSGITYLRNRHISTFLYGAKDCTHYCQLDCDLILHNQSASDNLFDKLLAHDLDFVGGLYAYRAPRPGQKFPCSSILKGGAEPCRNSGLVEALYLSGGCWLVKREVIERMAKAFPELEYDTEDGAKGAGLFLPFIYKWENGFRQEMSEDYAFCHRWREIGGTIWADTAIDLGHIGLREYKLWERPEHLGGSNGVCHVDAGALQHLKCRFGVKTMMDLGCGLGHMQIVAKVAGITWMGVEADPEVVQPWMVKHDFTKGALATENPVDLGWAVEFLEHVDEKYLPNIMRTFQNCRVVCVTHALPNALGVHHVNCREPDYWIKQFEKYGFEYHKDATDGVRTASTMLREFMRNTGMVFTRKENAEHHARPERT